MRKELNLTTSSTTQTGSASSLPCEGYVNLDLTKFSNVTSVRCEVSYTNSTTSIQQVFLNHNVDSWRIINLQANTTSTIQSQEIPVSEVFQLKIAPVTSGSVTVHAVRIFVVQDESANITDSESSIEIGFTGSTSSTTPVPGTAPKYWNFDSSKFDGTLTCFLDIYGGTNNNMYAASFVLQVSDETGNGFAGWTDVLTISTTSTPTFIRSSQFTPINGRNYRIAYYGANSMGSYTLYSARIIIQQNLSTGITKTQSEYLIQNKLFLSGTADQGVPFWWVPSAWGTGMTHEYFHVVDSSANNTSVIDLRSGGTQISGSVVNSPNNRGTSSSITMPGTNQIMDVRATTNSGNLYASRLIVNSVKATAPPPTRRIFIIS